jgi:hypothetical protein
MRPPVDALTSLVLGLGLPHRVPVQDRLQSVFPSAGPGAGAIGGDRSFLYHVSLMRPRSGNLLRED